MYPQLARQGNQISCVSEDGEGRRSCCSDRRRAHRKPLEVLVALAGNIFARNEEKPFGGPMVRQMMQLRSWAGIEAMSSRETFSCIRILQNFGLIANLHFCALWDSKNGDELCDWQSKHRLQVQIATCHENSFGGLPWDPLARHR
jgi:hypothetical protein